MQIYNTLTRKKEDFIPQNPGEVTMYVCGPTVYDIFHIGNARSFIMADIVRRYLEYCKYYVRFVMNITDIDDKIIRKANEEKITAKQLADKYAGYFLEDIKKLKIKNATIFPRATEHIEDIITIIRQLEENGYAYNIDGNVFYNVAKFPEYGKLSGKVIEELQSGARIEINEQKNNPLDFALWKKAKDGEPSWDSPWGKGRPGWHIECSAMSTKHLGETIDIHAGGNDLIFPHHENEIAQSEAAHKHQFVRYWIHFGFLNIQNEKMSKSLGNFFTAREVLNKFSAETIRLFFVQTHYAGPLSFSDELLISAQKGLEKITNLAEKIVGQLANAGDGVTPEFNYNKYRSAFEEAMNDDFNTPQATAVIFDFLRDYNRTIAENAGISKQFYQDGFNFLKDTAEGVLGIIDFNSLSKSDSPSLENELIELLIQLRAKAKIEKNYGLSDDIREGLKNIGIVLQDTKERTTYKKLKT